MLLSKPQPKSQPPKSVARQFANVNAGMPPTHWDYEAVSIGWGDQEHYLIDDRVGRGKYSEVFSGYDQRTDSRVIIKVLKPVRTKKIKREIKILQVLYGCVNVIKLYDLVRDADSRSPAFIFEHVKNHDHKELYPKLSDMDIRFYLFELLRALQCAHSHGIMHRDVKPHNIMIDHDRRELKLIDWGLAEFYHPGVSYNCRVASRYYKGPELLVDFQEYDYSLDMWSVGCVMAGMCFGMEVFFHGADNADQLVKIVKVLGTDGLEDYLARYDITLPDDVQVALGKKRYMGIPLETFSTGHEDKAHPIAVDLIKRLLKYDHLERLTAEEAMQHPYFDPVRH